MRTLLFAMVFALSPGMTAAAPPPAQKLAPSARETLRFQLRSLLNGSELLVLNRKVDAQDLQKQEQDLARLRVYERIPLEDRLQEMRQRLKETAEKQELRTTGLRLQALGPATSRKPERVFSDSPRLRRRPEEVVRQVRVEADVTGRRERVLEWVRGWNAPSHPFLELVSLDPVGPKGNEQEEGRWKVQARAYVFRKIPEPVISLRDPLTLLPVWARKDPGRFRAAEPELWGMVERISSLKKEAAPLLETRARFQLNDARLSFFLSRDLALPHR